MSNEQNFWLDLPKPFFILAPMEDVTDVVFRHVINTAAKPYVLLLQLDLHDKYSKENEPRPFKPLLRFFKIYVRGFKGASELRNQLMDTASTDEVRRLVKPVLDQELD